MTKKKSKKQEKKKENMITYETMISTTITTEKKGNFKIALFSFINSHLSHLYDESYKGIGQYFVNTQYLLSLGLRDTRYYHDFKSSCTIFVPERHNPGPDDIDVGGEEFPAPETHIPVLRIPGLRGKCFLMK